MKNEKKKSRKEGIFPKGLVHGFDEKLAIFPSFYFRQKRTAKCVSRYSRTKKTAFDTKKTTSQKKSKNWDFSKRDSPWSWSKKGNCSILFIFGKIGQENVFHDILQKKPPLKILKTVI